MVRVLYAEDDSQISQMVQLYFMSNAPECRLEVVNSGRKCLERMAQECFDVVMVDLMMPEFDGLEVLGQLAARRDATPVIMVSGHGQNDLAVQALRAGAVDCIDKNSAEFRQIAEIVRRVHARHKSRVAAPASTAASTEARVMLVESSEREAASIVGFFNRSARLLRSDGGQPRGFRSGIGKSAGV